MKIYASLLLLFLSSLAFGQSQSVSISGNGITVVGVGNSGGVVVTVHAPASVPPVVIQTTSLPNGLQNASYSQQLVATGGTPCTGSPYSWLIFSGALPTGYTLSSSGIVGGSTSSTGVFNFSVTATDCNVPPNTSAVQNLSITVSPAQNPGVSENQYLLTPADGPCTYPGGVTFDGLAQLPVNCFYTGMDGTPAGGTVIDVINNSQMTAALSSVACGQVIRLHAANGPYQGFQLPSKGCNASNWIWIETDQTGAAGFPAEHNEINPCASNQSTVADQPTYSCTSPAQLTAQIICTGTQTCISAAAGANFYRLIGLDVFCNPTSGVEANCVDFSGSAGGSHFIVDRSLVHGPAYNCTMAVGGLFTCPSQDVQHGVLFGQVSYGAFINGWVYNIGTAGTFSDATGINLGGNGCVSGQEDVKKFYNSYLSAAGEAWIAGGGGCGTGTVTPNDLEIRAVHTFKPVKWLQCNGGSGNGCHGGHPVLKNNGELKNWNRALIEDSVCENSWDGWQTDQAGFCFLITPKSQSNSQIITWTSDATGTILTGPFPTNTAGPGCAPGGCHVVTTPGGSSFTQVQSRNAGPPVSVTVSPAVTPNFTCTSCKIYLPGLNPNATVTNATYRWDQIMNVHNGIQLGAGVSDGGDFDLGVNAVELHDIFMEGVNYLAGNGIQAGTGEQGVEEFNGMKAPNQLHNWAIEHVTVAGVIPGANFSFTGMDFAIDGSDPNGSGVGQMTGRIVRNNIGIGGGLTGYNQGSLYPNGANNGLTKQSGGSFTYTENVLGVAQWTHQLTGLPFPASNADPGDNPAGTGCGTGSATCHPNGTAFTALFQSYNGPNGQVGYLGNYQLICPSGPYCTAGTDGLPLGVSNWTTFATNTQGVWSPTTYTQASITQGANLPNAIANQAYSQAIATTSASPAQNWLVTAGAMPPGLNFSATAIPGTWAIAGTATATGAYRFTAQMVDGAQQYASKTFTLTVTSGGPSGTANWAVAFANPPGETEPDFFDIKQSTNEWYLAGRLTGFWKSTNQGANWTNINNNITFCTGCGAWTINVNPNDGSLIAVVGGVIGGTGVTIWYSNNDGTSWTKILPTNWHASQAGADSGCAEPPAAGPNNVTCGGWFSSAGQAGWYSTNGGPNAALITATPAIASVFSQARNPVDGTYWTGTENGGEFCSTNGGQNSSNVQPFIVGPPTNGDTYFITFDALGDVFYSTQGGIWEGTGGSNCANYTFTNIFTNAAQGRGILVDSFGSLYWGHKPSTGFPSSLYRSTNGGSTFQAWDQCPTCTGGTLPTKEEMDKMVENTNDGLIYGVLELGSTNAANVYSTRK